MARDWDNEFPPGLKKNELSAIKYSICDRNARSENSNKSDQPEIDRTFMDLFLRQDLEGGGD